MYSIIMMSPGSSSQI